MTSRIVDERALDHFLRSADLDEARLIEASLAAMTASARLKVVELETRPPTTTKFTPAPVG